MTSKVNNFLNFDRGCVGESECIAIGQRNASGSFFIHHLISSALREKKCVYLLSLVQKFHHYNSIARKLGTNLQMAQDARLFVFLDGLDVLHSEFFLVDGTSQSTVHGKHTDILIFRRLKEQILRSLTQFIDANSTTPLLVIDDVSVLLSVGLGFDGVGAFVSSLVSEIMDLTKTGSNVPSNSKKPSVVILSSYAEEDRESVCLWKFLSHISSISVNVTGLQTGYCKDVHGQEIIRRGHDSRAFTSYLSTSHRQSVGVPVTAVWNDRLDLPRSYHKKTVQFKVSETNVDFFASGMSPAVI